MKFFFRTVKANENIQFKTIKNMNIWCILDQTFKGAVVNQTLTWNYTYFTLNHEKLNILRNCSSKFFVKNDMHNNVNIFEWDNFLAKAKELLNRVLGALNPKLSFTETPHLKTVFNSLIQRNESSVLRK